MLEAVAVERSAAGRTGVYDVTVSVVGGKTVALFRGKSYRIKGEVTASFALGLSVSAALLFPLHKKFWMKETNP